MTYDIRDTMIEAFRPILDRQNPFLEWNKAEELATTALSVITNHLANEPRTKAETALIEFAEGKVRAMRGNGFLHSSDRAIPREILQAFVEELK